VYLPWIQTIGKVSSRIYQALGSTFRRVTEFRYNIETDYRLPPKYFVVWLLCTLLAIADNVVTYQNSFSKNGLRRKIFTMDAQVVLEHGYKRNLVILSVYYLRQSRNSDDRVTAGDNE